MPGEQTELKFEYSVAQKRLFRTMKRGGGTYLQLKSPQSLDVGGQRSGKTVGKLMFGVQEYCLRYGHCDMLVLRRTTPELDSGAIADFKAFVPEGLYDFNHSSRVATFKNGSRIVFASCVRKGSLITTERGLVPIEFVTTNDRVLTRKGYRRVKWAGLTGVRTTIKFDNIWLTPEHLVYSEGKFIPAEELLCQKDSGKTVLLCRQKWSYSRASFFGAIQQAPVQVEDTNISSDGGIRNTLHSTERSTNFITAFIRKIWTYITKTTTGITTLRTISNCLNELPIESITDQLSIPWSVNAASFVEINSTQSTPINEQHALNYVEEYRLQENRRDTSQPVPVYDLTIEEVPEFFANGILIHNCPNNVERDIEKYLGQAFPYILVDECAQFSPTVWMRLYARNLVNAACERDEHGNLPVPSMAGCTNPIGQNWDFYYTVFIKGKPWEQEDGTKRAKDGSYWRAPYGPSDCVYNPADYCYSHTTVLDNEIYLQRDPRIIQRLQALPPALRKKFLEGYLDTVEGAYFDPWSEERHVIDLRDDPEAIVWEDWQPVWAGQDFGVGHWNAIYLFTRALVRVPSADSLDKTTMKYKIVCFKEIAPDATGQTDAQLAAMLNANCYYPKLSEDHPQFSRISGKRCKLSTLYFSHEKFARQMSGHSPVEEYGRILRGYDLPTPSRASTDRIGSAMMMYNMLKKDEIVILRTCPGIIQAIPALQRDKDNLDDVLKTDAKPDDRYDAFRYGLYGFMRGRAVPQIEIDKAKAAEILDPLSRFFFLRRKEADAAKATEVFRQNEQPVWARDL